MSPLAMTTPSTHPMFRNDSWDAGRPSPDYSRPCAESKSIALPSIRQVWAEVVAKKAGLTMYDRLFPTSISTGHFPLPTSRRGWQPRARSLLRNTSTRPTRANGGGSRLRTNSLAWEPNKFQGSIEARNGLSPDNYRRLTESSKRLYLPRQLQRRRGRVQQGQAASYASNGGGSSISGSAPPAPVEMNGRVEPRLSLPSLPPPLNFERESAPMHVARETVSGNSAGAAVLDRAPAYQSPEYGGYSYHHPTRYQSLSTSSIRSYDRAPFSAGGGYGQHYHDMGSVGMSSDAKQRKRRGNLPNDGQVAGLVYGAPASPVSHGGGETGLDAANGSPDE